MKQKCFSIQPPVQIDKSAAFKKSIENDLHFSKFVSFHKQKCYLLGKNKVQSVIYLKMQIIFIFYNTL